jgi:hypothetical protein
MLKIEGKLIENPQTLANTFYNYFSKIVDESVTNIIKQDHNQINQHPHLEYLVHEYPQPFLPINFKPVTKKEISEINRSLKWKNSYSYDEVPTRMVKLSIPFIASPLIYICNRMLSTGTFSTCLKFSQVYPLFRRLEKTS